MQPSDKKMLTWVILEGTNDVFCRSEDLLPRNIKRKRGIPVPLVFFLLDLCEKNLAAETHMTRVEVNKRVEASKR